MRWTLLFHSSELLFLCAATVLSRYVVFDLLKIQLLNTTLYSVESYWALLGLYVLGACLFGVVFYYLVVGPAAYYHMYLLRRRAGLAPPRALRMLGIAWAQLSLRSRRAIYFMLTLLICIEVLEWWTPPALLPGRPVAWWPVPAAIAVGGYWAIQNRWQDKSRVLFGCKRARLERGELSDRLQDFARAHGVDDLEIYVFLFSEIGTETLAVYREQRGRPQVCFSDTMIELLEPDELLAVFAHELAHHQRRDPLLMQLTTVVGHLMPVAVAWGILATGPQSLSLAWRLLYAWPVILSVNYILTFLVTRPIYLAWQRRQEARANADALAMTGDPGAFLSAMSKLARNNLATGRPDRLTRVFFSSHPSLEETANQAKAYAARHDISLAEEKPFGGPLASRRTYAPPDRGDPPHV
jgi:Zn-dependent protease with chaperone function